MKSPSENCPENMAPRQGEVADLDRIMTSMGDPQIEFASGGRGSGTSVQPESADPFQQPTYEANFVGRYLGPPAAHATRSDSSEAVTSVGPAKHKPASLWNQEC